VFNTALNTKVFFGKLFGRYFPIFELENCGKTNSKNLILEFFH